MGTKTRSQLIFMGRTTTAPQEKGLDCWDTGAREYRVHNVPLRYSAHSTSPISALWPAFGILQPFELFERLERFELVLGLPATAQRSVELHDSIQLTSPHPGQCQLLVEELLVGDQNL
jgi:hypothetical protein